MSVLRLMDTIRSIFSLNKPTDTDRIMEDAQQFADPSVTTRSVCFHCEKKVTAEMVKKSIQEVDIESCVLLDDSNCDVLVVFKHKAGNYSLLKYCIPLVAPVRR